MNKKILVTGGLGYIGSHTVVELQKAGYTVLIVDNLSNSNIKILDQIERITGIRPEFINFDLCDDILVYKLAKENSDIENIIHFAAYKAVGESVSLPLKYYQNNLYPLINLLQAFSDRKLNLVFSSSCTVYGTPDVLPVTENSPVKKAESPYGNTKQICEEILSDTSKANENIKIISLRYFNPIGAHESGLIGELPLGIPSCLGPLITQTAIGKRKVFTVFGEDYDTLDGTCIRDYVHIVDLARAHLLAMKRIENENTREKYEIINIGTGKGTSVLQAINAFENATGVKLNYSIGARRPGDVEKIWADATLAEKLLSFKAEHSLKDMMSSAWKWEKYLKENPM